MSERASREAGWGSLAGAVRPDGVSGHPQGPSSDLVNGRPRLPLRNDAVEQIPILDLRASVTDVPLHRGRAVDP